MKDFKKKVLDWLASEKVDISGRRVRVYNSPRYGLEVRIYNEPMELPNSRKSFRETSREQTEDGIIRHGMTGIFSRKITTYIHINEKDFESKEEKANIIEMLKQI